MKKIVSIVALLLLNVALMAQTTVNYSFNDLETGPLNGQDNWVSVKHSAGGGVFQVDYLGPQGITTTDESKGVFFKNANTNYGEVATRKSTENFSFDFSQGGIIELELDMSNQNYWGQAFGLGFDANGDGTLLPPMIYEAVYPAPNLPSQDGGIYLIISYNSPDDPRFHCGIVTPNNEMPIEFTFENREDWYRFRILIDLEANDGQGSVALFVDNGITGDFQPIPEIQGLNPGLTPGSGDRFDPNAWDAVFFLSSSHGGFDDFSIKQTPPGAASQFIDFAEISDKLISADSFELSATCTSGLPITYEVLSGPATIEGSTVTLNGNPGIVKIQASQPGNADWLPAPSVIRTFEVVDPAQFQPELIIRRPYEGTKLYMEELSPMVVVLSVDIEHSDVILVEDMKIDVDGQTINCNHTGNNYYQAIWTPSSYGVHNMELTATMSGDNSYTKSNSFEVVQEAETQSHVSFDGTYHIHPQNHVVTGSFVFPSFVGSFNDITAMLDLNCAEGGCDTYDRVGRVRAKNMHGDWVELFKYITPFGVACSDAVSVKEYASVLQGLVDMEFEIVTWNSGGYLPVLDFEFTKGTPEYKYSDIVEIWGDVYDFGDYANQQPIPHVEWNFNSHVEKAELVMSTTGHMWSSNTSPNFCVNTDNAAEFSENTHYVNIDGSEAFVQHLWRTCNPNPADCSPQNGTWYHNRAGWCPGSIAMIWNWDLTSYINNGNIDLEYELDPSYIDFCHPNHPDCVDGQNGCPNCGAPDNPILDVSGKVVVYTNNINMYIGVNDVEEEDNTFTIYPNPTSGLVEFKTENHTEKFTVNIMDFLGKTVKTFELKGSQVMNVSDLSKGVYVVNFSNGKNVISKKLIVQ